MATYQSYLNSLTDADLQKKIYCNRKQAALGVTIHSSAQTKNKWMAECGAILDNPSGNQKGLKGELMKRGLKERYKGQVLCSNYKCGGYTKGPAPTCPDGCKCGPGNPRIPDAPRTCVNSPVRRTSSKYGQIPEALPWIIGTGIAVFIIYKFR